MGMTRRVAFAALFAALAAHAALALGVLHAPDGDRRRALPRARARRRRADRARAAVAVRRNRARLVAGRARARVLDRRRPVLDLLAERAGRAAVPERRRRLLPRHVRAAVRRASAVLLRDRLRPFPAWLAIDGVLAGADARRAGRGQRVRARARRDRGQRRRRGDHAGVPRRRPPAADDRARRLRRDRLAPRARRGGCSVAASRPARSPTASTSSRSRRAPTPPAACWTRCGRRRSSRSRSPSWQRSARADARPRRLVDGRRPDRRRRDVDHGARHAGLVARAARWPSCSPAAALLAGHRPLAADARGELRAAAQRARTRR